MRPHALLVLVLACAPAATSAQEPPPAPVTPAAPIPLVERTTASVIELGTADRGSSPIFGMDLLFGQQTGIRPSVAVFTTERSAVLVEGYYGGLFSKFGADEVAGAGVRWTTTRRGLDSVTFGPGVDVLFGLDREQTVVLAPTLDVAWRHNFGEGAAFILGINAGVGVRLSRRERYYDWDSPSGQVTPLISMFAGFRF